MNLTATTTLIVNNNTTITDNLSGNFTLDQDWGGHPDPERYEQTSTAGTTVTGGVLSISKGSSLGSGLISLAGGTALQYSGGTGTIAQNISLTGTVGSSGA